MIIYGLIWGGIVFLISSGFHTLWINITNKGNDHKFYYQKSFWVIYGILFIIALILSLVISVYEAIGRAH